MFVVVRLSRHLTGPFEQLAQPSNWRSLFQFRGGHDGQDRSWLLCAKLSPSLVVQIRVTEAQYRQR